MQQCIKVLIINSSCLAYMIQWTFFDFQKFNFNFKINLLIIFIIITDYYCYLHWPFSYFKWGLCYFSSFDMNKIFLNIFVSFIFRSNWQYTRFSRIILQRKLMQFIIICSLLLLFLLYYLLLFCVIYLYLCIFCRDYFTLSKYNCDFY